MQDPKDSQLVKAFDSTEPKSIMTDRGLKTVAELSHIDNFQWTESPVCNAAAKKWIQQNKTKVIEHQLLAMLKETLREQGIPFKENATESEMLSMLGISKNDLESLQTQFAQEYAKLSRNPDKFNRFMLRNVSPVVGKGVFFASNAKPIIKGEYVCSYTGIYSADKKFLPYGVNCSEHSVFSEPAFYIPVRGYIDAKNYGNITRYFNDLPTEADLEEYYNIPSELRKEIATANLELQTGYYQQFPCGAFVALKDITAGQLGWSYGLNYFAFAEYLQGIQRCLFYLDGKVVDSKDYQVKYFNLQFVVNNLNENLCAPFKIRDLKDVLVNNKKLLFINLLNQQQSHLSVAQLLCPILTKLFNVNNPKVEDFYKFRFTCSIKLILLNFVVENSYNNDPLNQQRLSYVKKLQDVLVSLTGDQSDAIYTAVLNIINDPAHKDFYSAQLAELRSEVLKAMTKYNTDKKEALKQEQQKKGFVVEENSQLINPSDKQKQLP